MSTASAREYLDRMKYDDQFARQVLACGNAAERTAMVRAAGYDFSKEEVASLGQALSGDRMRRTLSQESRLGYDSELGHGWVPPNN